MTMTDAADLFGGFFDAPRNPREPAASLSLTHRPDGGPPDAVPLHVSQVPPDVDLSGFKLGMRMQGMTTMYPQQVTIAGMLDAAAGGVPLYPSAVVTMPRRASKTVSLWAVLLGRCATRPGYTVVTTAQSGLKARARFLEVARALVRNNTGAYRVLRGAGQEAVEWTNGSRLWVVPPLGDAFLGDAADAILMDEAQEHSPAVSADLLASASPLMDTRPGGQLIYAGTAGKSRAGMLWDQLELGRRGLGGIVEYAAPDTADPTDEAVWWDAHPGIGTLTTLDTIRDRYAKLTLARFQREYLGMWPYDISTRAIHPQDWEAARVPTDQWPAPPDRFALAYDIAPDQSAGALVAAWRDPDGTPWVEVVSHAGGDAWLPRTVHAWTKDHPNVRVGYDNIHAANVAVADRLTREARPRPKLIPLATAQITAAAAQLSQDIVERRLRVRVDPALDTAAEVATRRNIGDASWAWGRRRSDGDISALVAATNALKVYDLHVRARRRVTVTTAD